MIFGSQARLGLGNLAPGAIEEQRHCGPACQLVVSQLRWGGVYSSGMPGDVQGRSGRVPCGRGATQPPWWSPPIDVHILQIRIQNTGFGLIKK